MEIENFTKYEVARILGARALQLAMDAPMLMEIDEKKLDDMNYDVLQIAEFELEGGVLPITVKRPFPERKEEKIKKMSKEEAEEKARKLAEKEEAKEKKEDKDILAKEAKEEQKIKEEGEIMELATPADEVEESDVKKTPEE